MNEKIRRIIIRDGVLDLAGYEIPCYVLEDGTRVLSGGGIRDALKMIDEEDKGKEKTGNRLKQILSQKALKPFINREKKSENFNPFNPIVCYKGGTKIHGYEATTLVDICNVFLEARKEIELSPRLKIVAEQSEILVRSFAKVGIIALVDEATGYQYEREKAGLQAILKTFISDEILKWQETFQLSFYKEIFRLWEIPFTAKNISRKPWLVGKLTSELVYRNLPKDTVVLEKLKEKTPKTKGGNYKYRLHQSLVPETGKEALKKVIYSVEALASVSKTRIEFLQLMEEKYSPQQNLTSNELDKQQNQEADFDKVLKTAINTPPLKLKDLKEQLKQEREKKKKL